MGFNIFDSHCHPQFPQYNDDREAVVQRALDAGVGMICVGTDLEMSRKAIELARSHKGVWASVGLHPNDNPAEEYDNATYLGLARDSNVIAVGEVGLDYYRTTDEELMKLQKARFEKQIGLAIETKKPLIIHCRDAHSDMYDMLKHYRDGLAGGVIHSFTGSYDEAKRYIGLGFYIGLNGIITFARTYDESVEAVPVDNILLETDAPYLTPVPYRGRRNEPLFVKEVARFVSKIKGVSIEEINRITTENTKRLLSLN